MRIAYLIKRFVTGLLLLSLTLFLFGCFLSPTDNTDKSDGNSIEKEPANDEGAKDNSLPDVTDGVLLKDKTNEYGYVIVCDKSSKISLDRALEIRYAILESTNVSLEIVNHKTTANKYEIVIPGSDRDVVNSLRNEVNKYSSSEDFLWGFSFNGKQFALYANNDYAWKRCVAEFNQLFFTEGKMVVENTNKSHLSCMTMAEYELEQKRLDTHLAPIFTSHAVLQRDCPVTLYGTGIGNVSVEFLGNTYEAVTEGDRFAVTLPPTAAGGPYTIKVIIEGKVTLLEDILFGDVILLAGQSNAELPMDQTDYPEEEYISNDRVRTYFVGQHFSEEFHYSSILDNRWAILKENEAAKWSAIAYHLGNRIETEQDVPVGIICVVKGASVIQSFMSPEAQAEFNFSPNELSIEHPCNTTVDRYKCFNQQAVIYETMFSKVKGYIVSSVIWYQGESNIGSGESLVYDRLLEAMITEWRTDLGNENLPFIIVKIHNRNSNAGWLAVREAQERAAANIENCYLVDLDSLGICTDIHPQNKAAVSELIYNTYYKVED